VRKELGKGNNDEIYRRVLRVWLALTMETRKGTEESPRGLCEISSSTRPVNETEQGSNTMRKGNRGKKESKADPRNRGEW